MRINSTVHGIIDYLIVLFLLASPTVFGLPEATSMMTYFIGVGFLFFTLFTNFELGPFKVIPFPIHGWIELAASLAFVIIAIYVGKAKGEDSRNVYFVLSAIMFLSWCITSYSSKRIK